VLRRLLLPLLVAAVALTATGCASDVSPALRVGSVKISNDTFLDEVAEWAGNPVAVDQALLGDGPPGTFPLELVRQLMQQRIDFVLHNEEFAALGLEVDDELRQEALTVLFGDPSAAEEAFSTFSDSFAAQFTDDVARQIGVQNELGDDAYSEWRTDVYADADVEVNPRYGRWDAASGQVLAPDGPREPAGNPLEG
jgi:hypothetical protein